MNKFISVPSLKKIINRLQKKGKTVVFTNGCFDIIHSGHIKVFEKSKSLGDILILGLNSDSSIKRLKGSSRPIMRQDDRIAVLSAISFIDYIAVFNEDTPEKLIRSLKPDILVKGGDYNHNEIVGREYVKKVVRIPLVKGKSTSNVIEKILKVYGEKRN